MKNKIPFSFSLFGGISGMLSIVSYLTVAFLDLPVSITFLLAMFFPIGGIIFIFTLKELLAVENDSPANQLSFTFGSLAYCTLAIFLAAQLSVNSGFEKDSMLDAETVKFVKGAVRMIDMGIDVAWDMFIGSYLILFLIASSKTSVFRVWGLIGGLLGLALIILNVSTFPEPPANAGMVDLGPVIAIFLFALSFKVTTSRTAETFANS